MSEIINLRQFKKAKARKDDDKLAAANRAKYGATKSEKTKLKLEERNAIRLLDGARLTHDTDDQTK